MPNSYITLPSGDKMELLEGNAKDVGDGHHTFAELYEHRILLFIAFMNAYPKLAWKSLQHHDPVTSPMFKDSFIAGMNLPHSNQQITYHIPITYWNLCSNIQSLDKAKPWDGHSSFDVLERLIECIDMSSSTS